MFSTFGLLKVVGIVAFVLALLSSAVLLALLWFLSHPLD
jgi:hypothetical protein